MCGPGCSPRASSRERKPPLIAASTTSFTVPPRPLLDRLDIVQRRPGPGVAPRPADGPAQRRSRGRPQGRGQLGQGAGRACGLPGGRGGIGRGPAQREGLPDREYHRVRHGPGGQLHGRGLGAHLPVAGHVRPGHRRGGLGGQVEDHAVQIGARDAVHHAVVHLGDERPAALGEPFGQPVLPQRAIAVEPLRHHPRHQVGELTVAAGRGQGGAPDVVAKVEVRVVHPDRPPQPERDRAELLAVARHQRQPPGQVCQHLLLGRRRTLEDGDGRDRHRDVRVGVLRVDEHGVQRVQPVHDGPPRSKARCILI